MPFEVPRFNVFCCGCTLRSGVFIIGFINLIILGFIAFLFLHAGIKQLFVTRSLTSLGFLANELFDLELISRIIFTLFLLHGCYQKNPSYMLAFLLMELTFIFQCILIMIFTIFNHIYAIFMEELLIAPLTLAIEGYFASIIYCHYKDLKEGRFV